MRALALTVTTRLFDVLGLRYRKDKLGLPSQRGVFLGVLFDTPRRSLAVAHGKLMAMVLVTRDILQRSDHTTGRVLARQIIAANSELVRQTDLGKSVVRAGAAIRTNDVVCKRVASQEAVLLRQAYPRYRSQSSGQRCDTHIRPSTATILQRPWTVRTAIRNADSACRLWVRVDAGDFALGAIVGRKICWMRAPAKHWLSHSSTWREVVDTLATVTTFREECTGRVVEIVYDNVSAALAVTRLSPRSHYINQLLAEISAHVRGVRLRGHMHLGGPFHQHHSRCRFEG